MAEYRLVISHLLKERLLQLCDQARAQGQLHQVKIAIKALIEELQLNPLGIGEVLYHLKHSGWPVCHVARKPWSVHYAVDEQQRVVYVTRIEMMG